MPSSLPYFWTWQNVRDDVKGLCGRLGFPASEEGTIEFLGYKIVSTRECIVDTLRGRVFTNELPNILCILHYYSMAKHTERTFQLVSFRSLPGGMAYYNTFLRRSPGQLAENFGSTPSLLERGVAILGGRKLSYADYSYELAALPLVPLTIILRQQSAEFEATANILFDSSASNYLPTEQLAGLAEVATVRLIHASKLA